uniref:Carboxylesterase type B domain-containing protein n=1 Tax=Dendroctonus ponderosae TaxID=77166 RepID=A0AAR5P2E8_DENPD
MKLQAVICVSLLLFIGTLAQQVTTPDGPVRGVAEQTLSGKTYYAYYTIPYAKPPTGSRRFLAPEAPDPWTEVHDGSSENPNICYQLYNDYDVENEDCLHLNVYTPQNPSEESRNLPVLVNIHGGGFITGNGLASSPTGGMSPKFLVEEDVIFVSFNYRLGVFGFLSTGDEVIPGNAGLADQIQALKWLKKNIAAFGGNPDKITIVGQSAGAASVGYLILSPAASGLFAGAILESGTPLDPWSYQRNQTEISFKTASFVDSEFDYSRDSQRLLEVLQSADARTVDAAATSFANWDAGQPYAVHRLQMQQGFYYTPIIESSVIPEYQYEALADGNINKVPVLMGICSEEGLTNLDQYLDNTLQAYDDTPGFLNPQDLHINNEPTWAEVGNLIKEEYSPSSTFVNNKLGAIQYFTEHDFAKGSIKHAELQADQSDVYFYEFAYSGQLAGNTEHTYPGSGNVSHVEEWIYLYWGWPVSGYPENDQLVHNRLVRIWTNFAKYQNPTPSAEELLQEITWPKVTSGNFQYVEIGNFADPNLTIQQGKPKSNRMEFWDRIYESYGNRPFDTYYILMNITSGATTYGDTCGSDLSSMELKLAIFLCTLFLIEALSQQVTTPDGPIKGTTEQTLTGNTYYAYYSIPYAKPPIGSRRFLAPEAPDPWTDVHDGSTENPNMCFQMFIDYDDENEDCLHLNVYTRQDPTQESRNLPVLVYIYGGGFIEGNALEVSPVGELRPKFLIEEEIVFVAFNYRLGPFGFMSTGDKVIPGNAGLADQIQALKWVNRNIAAFGGDPDRITIVGQSAGAASVGYLILSPAAKGLFSGAILESGTPLDPWAYQRNQTKNTFKTASFIDSEFETSTDSQRLLEVLQNVDARQIDAAGTSFADWVGSQPDAVHRLQMQQGFYFAPVIESSVVPEYQYEALLNGNFNNVPILIGTCSEEGLTNLDGNLDDTLEGYDRTLGFLNPQDLHIQDEPTWVEVGNILKEEYSPSSSFLNNRLGGIQYFTEHDFVKGAVKHAELQSAMSDVYFYEFAYSGELAGNTQHTLPGSGNVSHVEEWLYLYWGWPVESFPEGDQLIHHRLIRIWTNFIKYRNPTPSADELLQEITWPKVTAGNFQYVKIGNFADTDLTIVQGKPKADRMAFWDTVYEKYGNRPFDTY